jgi:hypothetical protein
LGVYRLATPLNQRPLFGSAPSHVNDALGREADIRCCTLRVGNGVTSAGSGVPFRDRR